MRTTNINGYELSAMQLGTVQLGIPYGDNNLTGQPSVETAQQILQTAVDAGITSFDTSRAYGTSEDVIGLYLQNCPKKDELLIATKFSIDPEGDITADGIKRQVFGYAEGSLKKLGLSTLPLLYLHTAPDLFDYAPAIHGAMEALRSEGLIKMAGVSVYHTEEIREMLRHDIYEAVQLPMNLCDSRLVDDGSIAALKEAGIAVVVRSVFLRGVFFLDPDAIAPEYSYVADALRRFRGLAEKFALTPAELAACYIRDIPGITSLVLGCETVAQVEENARILSCPRLTDAAMEEILAFARTVPIARIMADFMNIKA